MFKKIAMILLIGIFGLAAYSFIRLRNAPLDTHLAVMSMYNDARIMFEHQTNKGNFLLFESGDMRSLTFFTRGLGGVQYVYSSSVESYVVMQKSELIPFTVYVGVSEDENLHEVIVIEAGFPIAHSSHMMPSIASDDNTLVWMVASSDLAGEEFFIVGLSESGEVLFEFESSGKQ